MNKHFTSNWNAMGLNFNSAFDILSRPKAKPNQPPKKCLTRSRTAIEKTLASLDSKAGGPFNTPIMTREESDLTLAIRGASC